MKNFNKFEQALTSYLPGAIRRSKAEKGLAVEDVEWLTTSVEAKTRASVPSYVSDWLVQAETNCKGRHPVVVWHGNYTRMGEQFTFMRLKTFRLLVIALHLQCGDATGMDQALQEAAEYLSKHDKKEKGVQTDNDANGPTTSD